MKARVCKCCDKPKLMRGKRRICDECALAVGMVRPTGPHVPYGSSYYAPEDDPTDEANTIRMIKSL